MKNKNKQNNKKPFFSIRDINGVMEGLDLAINFSLLPFLSIYFFNSAGQFNSIIYLLSIICLSLFIRPFVLPLILSFRHTLRLKQGKIYLIILPLSYLFPVILPNESFLFIINLSLIISSRILIGATFAINNNILNEVNSGNISKFYNSKYFLFPIIGVLIGLVFSVFLNQVFSNSDLNMWGWKLGYIFMIISSLLIYFFFFRGKKEDDLLFFEKESFYNGMKVRIIFNSLLENIYILIPVLFVCFFSMSLWLPKAVLSENMFFLDISIIYIVLIFIAAIFLNFIFDLIGKEKVYMYFCVFGIIMSVIFFVSYSYKSSYSINLLNFFISIVSAISIPLYFSNIKKFNKNTNLSNIYFALNIIFLIISLLIPFAVYYLMNDVIMYRMFYVVLSFIFLMSLIGKKISYKD